MIAFIQTAWGGYQDMIRIENEKMLLMINVNFFFPASKNTVTKLLKLMRENDNEYKLSITLDKLVCSLDAFSKADYVSASFRKRLRRNIDVIAIFNGLYGGIHD